jgi:hypothetical protein
MSAEGTWNLTIVTPIGAQHALVELSRDPDDSWHGTATDQRSGECVVLAEIAVSGSEIGWQQSITKPMRLNLTYTLQLDGDRLTGKAKAGRLPAVKVSGFRSQPAAGGPGTDR